MLPRKRLFGKFNKIEIKSRRTFKRWTRNSVKWSKKRQKSLHVPNPNEVWKNPLGPEASTNSSINSLNPFKKRRSKKRLEVTFGLPRFIAMWCTKLESITKRPCWSKRSGEASTLENFWESISSNSTTNTKISTPWWIRIQSNKTIKNTIKGWKKIIERGMKRTKKTFRQLSNLI